MVPPSNSHKPRQFLRPALPFQEAPEQAEPQLPMPESSQQNVLWQQHPITDSYPNPVNESNFTASFSVADLHSYSVNTDSQAASPSQSSFSGQPAEQLFAPGKQHVSPLPPFAPGRQKLSQFHPLASSKHDISIHPVTDRQSIPPLSPFADAQQDSTSSPFYGSVQQGAPSFQGLLKRSASMSPPAAPGTESFPFPMTGPQYTPGMPGDIAGQQFPMTGPQYTPDRPDGFAGQQFNNFQPSAFSQGTIAMPGFSSGIISPHTAPVMPGFSSGIISPHTAPVMPGFPGMVPNQQLVPPSWNATTTTGARPTAQIAPSPRKPAPVKAPARMPGEQKGRPVAAAVICLALLLVVVLVSQRTLLLSLIQHQGLVQTNSQDSANSTPLTPGINTITNNKNISPFLFGVNMALFHDYDETIIKSAATRQQLKNIGVRIVRMPFRTQDKISSATTLQAAGDIKAIGASALVVMPGPEFKDGPLFDADQQAISMITGVFGKQPVYFEFGNESDLNHVDAAHYTAKWNEVIPLLKKQFPTARFVALDNFQFDRRYLKTFLTTANPLPDAVSWHEYTCSVTWSADFCLANIDSWPIHFAQARAAMKEAIGKELPIWITEWNYVSDQEIINGQPINDGKYNDPAFIKAWTTKAMNALIQGRISAAMQYFATDQPMPLIYHDQIQTEGQVFQQNYKSIMVSGNTPPAVPYQVPPPVMNPNAQYTFENGAAGWSLIGGGPLTTTTVKALDGTHALKVTLADASEDDFPTISVNGSTMASPPKAGQMITTYVYVANSKALMNAKIFVADPLRNWKFANSLTLTAGAWNKVWFSLPLNYTSQVAQVGIQFFTSTPGVSTDVYIDNFGWK